MSNRRASKMQAWRWAVMTACMLAAAPASAQDQFLDFNDNQVPAGWTLGVDSGKKHCGVAHRHFYAGQTESRCWLKSAFTPLPSTKNVTIKWKGNLIQTGNGNFQQVTLSTADGDWISIRIGPDTSHTNDGVVVVVFHERMGEFLHFSGKPDGNYHFKLEVTDEAFDFTGTLDGIEVFKAGAGLSSFRLASLKKIDLEVYQSVGKDQWMDNVAIRQFDCARPVYQSCD